MSAPAGDAAAVLVVGAGPAGVMAALRAAQLGARTTLITSGAFGGMAANDGPVPVRTLAHAARLLREARQLGRYGVAVSEAALDYPRLLVRVREVVGEVAAASTLRPQIDAAGVVVHERAGAVRFVGPDAVVTAAGDRYQAARIILATGGVSRRLPIPGFELTATHSDAWSLTAVPASMLVVGAGATGAQVASVFNAFGTKVQLFQAGERILPTEEPEVSAAVAAAFRASGIEVHEGFGAIEAFEKTADGVRMLYAKDGVRGAAEAALVVSCVGWSADTAALDLAAAGVEVDGRGFVRVDAHQRTSAPQVFAAGDVTGGLMLVGPALQAGFVAATNAVRGPVETMAPDICPVGSFTDPEYAQVGLGEARAREQYDAEVVRVEVGASTRAVIDGRTVGFCKLIVDRPTRRILGCHLVGDRAVDVAQIAAVAIAGGLRVDDLARMPLSFPTYGGVLGRAAATAAHRLNQGAAAPQLWAGEHS
ncbi:NAD(P)/FAD-dependent oxidoreductase [Phenylobacterium sp. LjRoot219]|uniref:dihydrolipoyl dehydrogenase family protein n=1 Tax=Phenylobacterium sp. LjRoot219 TaxID=3342283 RepID=UPI003ED05FA4